MDGGPSAVPGAQFARPTRPEAAVPLQLEPSEAGLNHAHRVSAGICLALRHAYA